MAPSRKPRYATPAQAGEVSQKSTSILSKSLTHNNFVGCKHRKGKMAQELRNSAPCPLSALPASLQRKSSWPHHARLHHGRARLNGKHHAIVLQVEHLVPLLTSR